MVSTTESSEAAVDNGVTSNVVGVPPGRYRLVAWDVDTTGRRLIDEICQIAAYTPSSEFAQYVMPFSDLKPHARRRHNIRVVTVGRYRLLKDSKTNKVLKTKSEVYALTDFLSWLEETKGDAADGVILIFHEPRKTAPPMLLEALQRFNLLDRFTAVVKGFANSFDVAEIKCAKTVKSFSLRMLTRVLLDKDAELDNATERARLTYQIIQHLSQAERQDLVTEGSGDCSGSTKNMVELVREYTQPIVNELEDLASLKKLLECQNTLRPVFGAFMKSNRNERQFASHLRRLLAENDINYAALETTWKTNTRDGLSALIKDRVIDINEKDADELLEMLECHFSPDRKPMVPKVRPQRPARTNSVSTPVPKAAGEPVITVPNPPDTPDTTSKGESSSETTGNAYSDVGSAVSSENTPRSQNEEAVTAK